MHVSESFTAGKGAGIVEVEQPGVRRSGSRAPISEMPASTGPAAPLSLADQIEEGREGNRLVEILNQQEAIAAARVKGLSGPKKAAATLFKRMSTVGKNCGIGCDNGLRHNIHRISGPLAERIDEEVRILQTPDNESLHRHFDSPEVLDVLADATTEILETHVQKRGSAFGRWAMNRINRMAPGALREEVRNGLQDSLGLFIDGYILPVDPEGYQLAAAAAGQTESGSLSSRPGPSPVG